MYFGIYDNETIRKLDIKGKNPILIRILEPLYFKNGIPYKIDNVAKYKDVLELYFDDIISTRLQNSKDYKYFTQEMAQKLNKFILENDFDEIAIHCNAGISRSPAIGLCIAKILTNKELENCILEYKHFIPNKQVLSIFDSFKYKTKEMNENIDFRNLEIYHFDNKKTDEILNRFLNEYDEER